MAHGSRVTHARELQHLRNQSPESRIWSPIRVHNESWICSKPPNPESKACARVLDSGFWITDSGLCVQESRIQNQERVHPFWTLDSEFWIWNFTSRIQNPESRARASVLDSGFWMRTSRIQNPDSGIRGSERLHKSLPVSSHLHHPESKMFRIHPALPKAPLDFGFWILDCSHTTLPHPVQIFLTSPSRWIL